MRGDPQTVARFRPARLILGALAFAIFALALQDDSDTEVALSQPSHSFVAKVSKDSKENNGGEKLIPVAATALQWGPSFGSDLLATAASRGFPARFFLRSIAVRAPPAVRS